MTRKSRLDYFWFILFSWDVNDPTPFKIYLKDTFGPKCVLSKWLVGSLNDYCRKFKLSLTELDGDKWSAFAKIEKGYFA